MVGQAEARAWLREQKPRIRAAIHARFDTYLRTLYASSVPPSAWDRLCDAKEERLLKLMFAVMRGAAQAHVLGGEELAEETLELSLAAFGAERVP